MRFQDLIWDRIPVKTASTADPATGDNPAAVTVTKQTRLLALGGLFTTDGTVLNRYVSIRVAPDGTHYIQARRNANPHAQSIATNYVASQVTTAIDGGGYTEISIPLPILLPVGGKFDLTCTTGIQACLLYTSPSPRDRS